LQLCSEPKSRTFNFSLSLVYNKATKFHVPWQQNMVQTAHASSKAPWLKLRYFFKNVWKCEDLVLIH